MNALYETDVLKVLAQVRPYIQADGGDVELVDIADNGIVSVRLTGNCVGCSQAGATIFDGIQAALQGQLAWVTGVEQVNGEAAPEHGRADVLSPVRFWQDRARGHVRRVLDALEDLAPGKDLPDAVPAFIDVSRGEIAALLRVEEDVLYSAAETLLGKTSGPVHMLKKEHDQLRHVFAEFTQRVIRYGAIDGPSAADLREAAQKLARTFEAHLQKEHSALFGALNELPEDFRSELAQELARHAKERGLPQMQRAMP